MNNDNNIPNFEQFLRTSVEDFRMIPARKIWFGIYNQVHPSKKWPSLVVSLIILTAILFAGISNNKINNGALKNNVPYTTTATNTQQSQAPINNDKSNNTTALANIIQTKMGSSITQSQNTVTQTTNAINGTALAINKVETKNNNSFNTTAVTHPTKYTAIAKTSDGMEALINNTNAAFKLKEKTNLTKAIDATNTSISIEEYNIASNKESKLTYSTTQHQSDLQTSNNITSPENNIAETAQPTLIVYNKNINTAPAVAEKNHTIVKDITAKNITETNRKATTQSSPKDKGSLLYYVTPAMGYRNMAVLRKGNYQTADIAALNDVAALNLELGAVLQYNVQKNITAKVGIQFNYTNYVSKVINLGHTMQTTVATNSFNAARSASVSSYLTKEGADQLNKTTWQIAVPVGADIALLGNDKIKWHLGGTLQPTYILGGSAMVLSADSKNYIAEKTLLRKVNINTAVETFVTIKTGKGIILNVGPQFRYQLFSTYKNEYNYSEKLFNLGLKIGVSTRL